MLSTRLAETHIRFSHRPWRSDFWEHSSLLVGFSVRKRSFWEDVYLGGAVPLANGVSASLLAHLSRRDIPSQVDAAQLLSIPGRRRGHGSQ